MQRDYRVHTVSLCNKQLLTSVCCHLGQTKHDAGTCKHSLASALVGFTNVSLGRDRQPCKEDIV